MRLYMISNTPTHYIYKFGTLVTGNMFDRIVFISDWLIALFRHKYHKHINEICWQLQHSHSAVSDQLLSSQTNEMRLTLSAITPPLITILVLL